MGGAKQSSPQIEEFLSNFQSDSTIRGYRCHLNQYFNILKKNPDKYIVDVRRLENGKRIDALDAYEKDLKDYWNWLNHEKYAPKTISNAVNCIRVFLKEYRIRLDDVIWENFRRRGPGDKPISKEMPITHEILQQVLIHGDARSRAMYLVMSSSGMRINELTQFEIDDIDFESNPTTIYVRYDAHTRTVKNKEGRTAFISDEASKALEEWLKQRQNFLNIVSKRTNFPGVHKKSKDNRVFPIHRNSVENSWNRLLDKAGYNERDKSTDRRIYHVYMLKKFFRTQMSKHNRDIAELVMGHIGYLDTYRKYTEEELKQEYLDGMKYLAVFEVNTDSKKIKEMDYRMQEKDQQIQELKAELGKIVRLLETQEIVKNMLKKNGIG